MPISTETTADSGASPDMVLMDALIEDETFYDRLVEAFPVFRKFTKVLMQENAAIRLCLADIASMADVATPALLAIANRAPLNLSEPAVPYTLPDQCPDWVAEPAWRNVQEFDARPLLENGHEPLVAILDFAEAARPDALLVVHATFHPLPLRRLFTRRGYDTFAEQITPDHWRVYFRRTSMKPVVKYPRTSSTGGSGYPHDPYST